MKTLSKDNAIALVCDLCNAAIQHYQAVNEPGRKSPERSARRELLAARRLIQNLTNEPFTDDEITQNL